MVAAGAFIGRHVYSDKIAPGRPDDRDRAIQRKFGEDIQRKVFERRELRLGAKLRTDWPSEGWFSTFKCALLLAMPGISTSLPASWAEKEITDACVACGGCERRCPTGAVDIATRSFDLEKCIGCFACGSRCPQGAIEVRGEKLLKVMKRIEPVRARRREPVLFI